MNATTSLRGLRVDHEALKQLLDSQALMSITSAHFEQWRKLFLNTRVSHKSITSALIEQPRKSTSNTPESKIKKTKIKTVDLEKIDLNDTIVEIKRIKLARGKHASLITNLLYACYQAVHAVDPVSDDLKIARDEYRSRIAGLPKMVKQIEALQTSIKENHDLVSLALNYSYHTRISPEVVFDWRGFELPAIIQSLLAHLREELNEMKKSGHPGLLDFDLDYLLGPLWFLDNWNRHKESENPSTSTFVFPASKKPEANQLGLIFHLVYLIRYFTVSDLGPNCKAQLNSDGELIDLGAMIISDVIKQEIVAQLYNAAFAARDRIDKDRRKKVNQKNKHSTSEEPLRIFEPATGKNIEERLREHITEPLIKPDAKKHSKKDSVPPQREIGFPEGRVFWRGWKLTPIK
jgi:hypothetical protein